MSHILSVPSGAKLDVQASKAGLKIHGLHACSKSVCPIQVSIDFKKCDHTDGYIFRYSTMKVCQVKDTNYIYC